MLSTISTKVDYDLVSLSVPLPIQLSTSIQQNNNKQRLEQSTIDLLYATNLFTIDWRSVDNLSTFFFLPPCFSTSSTSSSLISKARQQSTVDRAIERWPLLRLEYV